MDDILQKIVDGEYEIQPDVATALDGGTVSFRVVDETGRGYVLFLDRRMRTDTRDVFYKDEYPGKEGSTQLGSNVALVAKIETALKANED